MALITRKFLRQLAWFVVGLVMALACLGAPTHPATATVPSATPNRLSDSAGIVQPVPEALDTWHSHLQANFYP